MVELPKIEWQRVRIKCRGISPILFHRRPEETEEELITGVKGIRKFLADRKEKTLRTRAVVHFYPDEEGRIGFPAGHLWGALINAGQAIVYKTIGRAKERITTKDGTSRLAKLIRFEGKRFIPLTFDGRELVIENEEDWEVDKDWAPNPTTGAPMPIIRPMIENWEFELTFSYNANEIDEKVVLQLWAEAGLSQGIGSKRAEKGHPYGQFEIIEWQPIAS